MGRRRPSLTVFLQAMEGASCGFGATHHAAISVLVVQPSPTPPTPPNHTGCQAVVELRNDDTLRGRLARVDDDGGVAMESVVWTRGPPSRGRAPAGQPPPPPQPSPPLESVYIRGPRIRFIHLPPGIDPPAVVEARRAEAAAARAGARRAALTAAHAAGRPAKGDGGGSGDGEGESELD